ncbi:MAG: glycosyltransferase, partial [Planctomycetota bacterium]
DRAALRAADLVAVHTEYHRRYTALKFRVPRDKMLPLPLSPGPVAPPPPGESTAAGPFRVHWHGRHLAQHGVDVILRAAGLLADEAIRFTLVGGGGPAYRESRRIAERLGLPNVTFLDDMPYEALLSKVREASVCLGLFGTVPRAKGVVSNKVVDAFAMRKPVVTGWNRPTAALLEGRRAALFVPRGDPEALAEAILRLREDPAEREALAEEGHRLYRERLSSEALERALRDALNRLLGEAAPGRRRRSRAPGQ